MHIKHFTRRWRYVPDPMHPGRYVKTPWYVPSGAAYPIRDGSSTYPPDANGWHEVPQELGERLCKFRSDGAGFFQPGQVADTAELFDEPERPARAEKPAAKPRPKTDS